MALRTNTSSNANVNPAVNTPIEADDIEDVVTAEEVEASTAEQEYYQTEQNLPVETRATPVAQAGNNSMAELADQGYEGLEFDWTSYPTISLQNEGFFVDNEGGKYGNEFDARVLTTKKRIVYRADPYNDPKRDLVFTYDDEYSQTGVLIADKLKEWEGQGKTVARKEYLEAVVELVDPEGPNDGDFRIVSISPTSKGRFTGAMAVAKMRNGGVIYNSIIRFKVGVKVTKVANPFYPFAFEVLKG